jgi:hypothetical protein
MEQVVEEMTLRLPCSINLSYVGHGREYDIEDGRGNWEDVVVEGRFGADFWVVRGNLRSFNCCGMLLLLRATCGAGLS